MNEKEEYSSDLENLIHKTIKKVTCDIETLNYNTAVSALMILLNAMDEKNEITRKDYRSILHLLNPFAPHITEELNESFGQKPICEGTWPEYDEAKTILNEKEIGVQVNGKLRGSIVVSIDDSEDVIKDKAIMGSFYVNDYVCNYIRLAIFENRNIDLGLSEEEAARTNYHSGWDFAAPLGTPFYSMCNGEIKNVVNTQYNDLIYSESGNATGNYVSVTCNNGFEIVYHHIKANSVPLMYRRGTPVREGILLGNVSTTGLSTGFHLHVGLKIKGEQADVLEYVDFNYKR